MNKLIKRIAAAFTAVAVTAAAGIFTASAENVTYIKGSDTDDLVNIMQSYCFIALDELDVRGHQHGSAIADRVVRNPTPEEGTSVESELCLRDKYGVATSSYIRRFENLNGTIKIGLPKDTLYVGSEYTAEKRGNQNFIKNSFGGNEHIVDNAGTVIADTDTVKYMDIDNLQRSFISYNKQLAKSTETGEVTLSGQKLSVSAMSGVVYYNINSANYYNINADSTIDFPANSTAILVLNIDMNGITEWNRKPLVLTEGGSTVTSGEEVINHQTANRIYYNFYDSSKTDSQYTGTISMTDKGWGTIIAPSAVLTVGTNFCGVLIASSVTATGETHFVGAYSPVTPIAETPVTPTNPAECKTEIEFDKVDGTNGCALEGALFGIYSDLACTNELFRATSDSSGVVRFKEIPAGTYYLKEIEPPTGFKKNEEIYTAYVVFDDNGNGSVTFGDERRTKLTVPNDPVSAAVSSTTEPQPVPTPSESTLNTTVPSGSNSSTTTTAESDGGSGTTSYKWTTPSYNRPVTTTTTVPTATTTTKRDGSTNAATAGQGGSKTDSTKKTTKSDDDSEAVTTKKTTKTKKNDENGTAAEKTTKTDKNGEAVTDSTDKSTVSGDETTPVTSKTNKTDTTRPPEETTAEIDAEKDVVTDEKSDKTNEKSDNDSDSAVTTDGSDESALIVVTSGHDNSTGVDLTTETDSTNSENPYTGVESAAGIAIIFGELALAAALLKKTK